MKSFYFCTMRWSGLVFAVMMFVMFLAMPAQGQMAKKDTTIILINNMAVQLETSEALNDLYNFKFEKADVQFRWFKKKYPWHPLPYFLLGLSEWWKIMPDTKVKTYDDKFLAYMDSSIITAENLYKRHPEYKTEAAFFLAAAYGFKGRLYSDEERKQWTKAASVGKSALNYLEISKQQNHLSPELLFGDALYNYFSVWVPENYPALKPLLWFFRKGDKKLGLEQLKEVSYNAFYTRTEAMVWLMRISNSYENNQAEAFRVSEYLHRTFPDNPYFHRYYARMLYGRGQYGELELQSKQILARLDSGRFGYESTSGRYAAFFLGQMYEARKRDTEAQHYYKLAVKYSEQGKATDSGYYLYSLISLGEIAERQGNAAEAKKYFTLVKKKSSRKDKSFKDAKKRLKALEKGD